MNIDDVALGVVKILLTVIVLSFLVTLGIAVYQGDTSDCKKPIDIRTVTVQIDGCQYIPYGGKLTHKGNCTNHAEGCRDH